MKIGKNSVIATIEKAIPPIAPAAKENQKGSLEIKTKGRRHKIVDNMVSKMGVIFG